MIERLYDAQHLARIHGAAFAAPHERWDTAAFATLLGRARDTARDHGKTRAYGDENGFVLVQELDDVWEILTLAVAPQARRRGLARNLLGFLCAKAGRAIWLEVAADNEPALALYGACGFIETGRRKAYYKRAGQKRVDALLMQWTKERV